MRERELDAQENTARVDAHHAVVVLDGGVEDAAHVDGAAAVDPACEVARAAGATIVAEPHATELGGRVCLFTDPDGNLWELLGR